MLSWYERQSTVREWEKLKTENKVEKNGQFSLKQYQWGVITDMRAAMLTS